MSAITGTVADKALTLAMHTVATVRCRPNEEWEQVGKKIDLRRRVNVHSDVLDWTCAHVLLQDGPASAASSMPSAGSNTPSTNYDPIYDSQPVTL